MDADTAAAAQPDPNENFPRRRAMARGSTRLNRNSTSWQRLTTGFRPPFLSEFARAVAPLGKTAFTESCADDLRVPLTL